MGEFKKSGGFNRGGGGHSNRPRFGGERSGFSRSGGGMGSRDGSSLRPQMFSAVCSDCNRKCEVPFRPTGDRPVFCNDCFGNKRGSSQDGNSRTQRAEWSSYDGNPRRDAPARDFPRRDFTPSAPSAPTKPYAEDKRIDELKRQLDAVNKKLDTIMEMMKVTPKMETVKVSPIKKIKATRELGERSNRRMMAKK